MGRETKRDGGRQSDSFSPTFVGSATGLVGSGMWFADGAWVILFGCTMVRVGGRDLIIDGTFFLLLALRGWGGGVFAGIVFGCPVGLMESLGGMASDPLSTSLVASNRFVVEDTDLKYRGVVRIEEGDCLQTSKPSPEMYASTSVKTQYHKKKKKEEKITHEPQG